MQSGSHVCVMLMCMFMAYNLLIQSDSCTPANPQVLCPGGQPRIGGKEERKRGRGRDPTSDEF